MSERELPVGCELPIHHQLRLRILHTSVVQARHDGADCSLVLDFECAGAVSKPHGFFQEIQRKAFVRRPDLCGVLLETIGARSDLFGRGVAAPSTG
jgi:hypothetical protein